MHGGGGGQTPPPAPPPAAVQSAPNAELRGLRVGEAERREARAVAVAEEGVEDRGALGRARRREGEGAGVGRSRAARLIDRGHSLFAAAQSSGAVKRSSQAEQSSGAVKRRSQAEQRRQGGDSSLAPHLVDLHVGAALRRCGAETGRGGDEAEQHHVEELGGGQPQRCWLGGAPTLLRLARVARRRLWSWRGGSAGQYTGDSEGVLRRRGGKRSRDRWTEPAR